MYGETVKVTVHSLLSTQEVAHNNFNVACAVVQWMEKLSHLLAVLLLVTCGGKHASLVPYGRVSIVRQHQLRGETHGVFFQARRM